MSHGWTVAAIRAGILSVCIFAGNTFADGALATAPGCSGEGPLLAQSWDSVPLPLPPNESEIPLGIWRLPISANRPDVLTEARIALKLVRGAGGGAWRADGEVTFNDPKPFGIPFSFQTIVLEWDNGSDRESAMLDWSEGCQSPGRSIFPRQSWTFTLDLKALSRLRSLEHLTLGVWGSQN